MSHDHLHSHDTVEHRDHARGAHNHSHAPQNFGFAFAAAAALNIAFVIVQVIYGVLANSVALIADAGHNFGDVVGRCWRGPPTPSPSGRRPRATPMVSDPRQFSQR